MEVANVAALVLDHVAYYDAVKKFTLENGVVRLNAHSASSLTYLDEGLKNLNESLDRSWFITVLLDEGEASITQALDDLALTLCEILSQAKVTVDEEADRLASHGRFKRLKGNVPHQVDLSQLRRVNKNFDSWLIRVEIVLLFFVFLGVLNWSIIATSARVAAIGPLLFLLLGLELEQFALLLVLRREVHADELEADGGEPLKVQRL